MSGTHLKVTQEDIEARAAEKGISEEEAKTQLEAEAQSALEARAAEEGKTVEELIAEEEELSGLVEKYGGDPIKMAKALKSSAQEVNKILERQKALEREVQEMKGAGGGGAARPGASGKKTRDEVKRDLIAGKKRQYPTLDDDIIEAMVEDKLDTMETMSQFYQADKATDRVEVEKRELATDSAKYPFYKRYKKEIDEFIDSQPAVAKMTKGIAERCYSLVVGRHTQELIAEGRKEKPAEEIEIEGEIQPGGPKHKATVIEKNREGQLTPRQAKHATDLGLRPDSYLSILSKHKKQAKADGLPEPELITDKWHK